MEPVNIWRSSFIMADSARVSILDPEAPKDDAARRLFAAYTAFRGRVANSSRIWAHNPYLAKFNLLAAILPQREGAGQMLSARVKEMAVLKTSHVNSCHY
jgi:alkylhydroperoxidase family enzyme